MCHNTPAKPGLVAAENDEVSEENEKIGVSPGMVPCDDCVLMRRMVSSVLWSGHCHDGTGRAK